MPGFRMRGSLVGHVPLDKLSHEPNFVYEMYTEFVCKLRLFVEI